MSGVDATLEWRCDPSVGDWLTFAQLSERYCIEGYSEEDLRRYWEEECVAEMRWDVDGQACSWLDFQTKYRGQCAVEELRRRWLRCSWLEEAYDGGSSWPPTQPDALAWTPAPKPETLVPAEAMPLVAVDAGGVSSLEGALTALPAGVTVRQRPTPPRDPYDETSRWLDAWSRAADSAGFQRGSLATLPSSAFAD